MVEFAAEENGLMAERQETAGGAEEKVSANLVVMNQNEAWVTHTYEVIAQANAITAAAVDMETGMRGYLLAGQDGFLAPYTDGAKQFYAVVTSLSETVNDKIARNVQEASKGTKEVSSNITGVNDAAKESSEAAGQLLNVVGDLTKQNALLRSELDNFLAGLRAA